MAKVKIVCCQTKNGTTSNFFRLNRVVESSEVVKFNAKMAKYYGKPFYFIIGPVESSYEPPNTLPLNFLKKAHIGEK